MTCSLSYYKEIEPCRHNRHTSPPSSDYPTALYDSICFVLRYKAWLHLYSLSLKKRVVQFLHTVILYFSTVNQAAGCTKLLLTFLIETVLVWRKLQSLCLINIKKCQIPLEHQQTHCEDIPYIIFWGCSSRSCDLKSCIKLVLCIKDSYFPYISSGRKLSWSMWTSKLLFVAFL